MLLQDRLIVYDRALDFAVSASGILGPWPKKHAIRDHLYRASESIVVNLASGVACRTSGSKLASVDYAFGSSLECAACLDLATVKDLVAGDTAASLKGQLAEVAKMLIGLRKSWLTRRNDRDESPSLKEEDEDYRASTAPLFFAHEELAVYRTAIEFAKWFTDHSTAAAITDGWYRKLDRSVTSIVLNIAEGNGRFSRADQARFLNTAEQATAKTSALLDLSSRLGEFGNSDLSRGKDLLRQIAVMLAGFSASLINS